MTPHDIAAASVARGETLIMVIPSDHHFKVGRSMLKKMTDLLDNTGMAYKADYVNLRIKVCNGGEIRYLRDTPDQFRGWSADTVIIDHTADEMIQQIARRTVVNNKHGMVIKTDLTRLF